MKDIGMLYCFLGLEVWHVAGQGFLGQGKYDLEILKRFQMLDCKLMPTPINL
jgi:hypothetical protein